VAELLGHVLSLFPCSRRGRGSARKPSAAGATAARHRAWVDVAAALLMLDEPSLGIMPKLVSEIFHNHPRDQPKRRDGLSRGAEHLRAWNLDRRTCSDRADCPGGTGKELLKSDLVRKAYLGM